MVAGGITPTLPQGNDSYTYLTRNNPSDDWLKRGIRSDAADLYRQQDVNVTLDHDYWRSSGTGGISDFNAHDTMLQMDMPLYDGRAFLRTDTVQLDAGRFSTDGSGKYYETFGTCNTQGCRGDEHQKTTGTSVAAGWKTTAGPPTSARRRWALRWSTGPAARPTAATGTTSVGRWRPRGGRSPARCWRSAVPKIRTPAPRGGVRATGVSLSASYDRGEANGVWADLSAHQITGKNVADNQRQRLMAGYYYKLINEDNRRLSVGLNTMLWHYQKDLSGYSLGQGGYYSPQQYLSLSLPVNYRQRTENWSWELGGSVSLSHSKTDSQRRYPLQGLIRIHCPISSPSRTAAPRAASVIRCGRSSNAASVRTGRSVPASTFSRRRTIRRAMR